MERPLAPNFCDLADTQLHRFHGEILARRRVAITAMEHFDRQIAELTATEEAIRAEFDRRFFVDHPDERRLPSDDQEPCFAARGLRLTSGSPTMLQDEFARGEPT